MRRLHLVGWFLIFLVYTSRWHIGLISALDDTHNVFISDFFYCIISTLLLQYVSFSPGPIDLLHHTIAFDYNMMEHSERVYQPLKSLDTTDLHTLEEVEAIENHQGNRTS